MKKTLLKGLLPITLASILAAGCSSNAAQTTTSETGTAQETTEENSSDSAKDTQKDQDGSRPEQKGRGKNGSEDNKPENGVVHVGDGGNAGHINQKVVITPEQQELIDATKDKFTQETYKDEENGVSLDYNLFIPADYDASFSYPLIMFIPDSSAAGKSSEEVLSQYYGADIWASDGEQEKHASFVFCPVFSETVVDDDFNTSNQIDTAVKVLNQLMEDYNIDTSRVYTTGQSMGCMTSLYLNSLYPDLFAASLFVSGQWDINILKPLENKKFFYVTCTGDQKASSGQTEVMDLFKKDGVSYSYLENLDPDASADEKNEKITDLLKSGDQANFVRFDGLDHMASFNYAYDLEAVRDWLFAQSK